VRLGWGRSTKSAAKIRRKARDYRQPAMTSQALPSAPAAVLDTNVLLDWLLFADPAATALGQAVRSGQLHWLACPAMLAEWQHVIARDFGPRWQPNQEQLLTLDLSAWLTAVADPAPGPLPCRDPDDQKFIDLALHTGAAWLLSRDKALLCLARKAAPRGLRVATPAQWAAAQPA
jgi:putative PIN family toxin of toxin-antitoxin system